MKYRFILWLLKYSVGALADYARACEKQAIVLDADAKRLALQSEVMSAHARVAYDLSGKVKEIV